MKRRVLILGIDGGTWRILEPAIRGGYMPWLAETCRRGCRGVLESTTPPKTPSAWTSFQTGCNPGRHGVYDFALWDRNEHHLNYVNSRFYSDTLWDIAGRAGRRVGVVNVPMTYPAWKINGYMVTGLMTPNLERDWTWPDDLAKELLESVPDYHIFTFDSTRQGSPHRNPSGFIDQMRTIIDNRTRAALHILRKEPLDLLMVHYQTPDVVQHVMWGYMEEGHPLYRADICDMIRRRFLGYIDEQLKILDDAFRSSDGSCITFMVSDHGFQPHTHRFQLGNWLAQAGFMTLHRLPRRYSKIKDFLASTHIGGMNDFLGKTPLGRTHLWRKIQAAIREPVYEVDWSLTRAYSFSRGSDGFVFLLDKESSRKAALEKELIRRFADLRNPRTCVPIFQRISRKDEVYQGPRLESMPDLILKPAAGYSVTGDVNPFCDDLLIPIRKGRDFHIGMHHPDGILVAAGDPIKSNIQIAGIRLIDVAPTVLACLGLDVSATMDGRVIQDLFKRTFFRNRSDMGRSLEETSAPDSAVYSPQDIHSIEDRLRSLGYIE